MGGRPEGEAFRREDGEVDYERWRGSALFQEGIEEVITLGERFRFTLLCGEEDSNRCHRKRLIGPALREKGVEILHIRGMVLWKKMCYSCESGKCRNRLGKGSRF